MRRLACAIFALLITVPVYVQGAVEPKKDETLIVFGNGIKNDPEDARDSRKKLEEYLKKTLPSDQFSRLTFAVAYNRTFGLLDDLNESKKQKVQLENLWRTYEDWFAGVKMGEMPSLVEDAFVADFNKLDFGKAGKEDLQDHMTLYRKQVLAGKKIVIVAHSQGNFFANLSYLSLSFGKDPIKKKSMRIVSVATPASFVAGSTLATYVGNVIGPEQLVVVTNKSSYVTLEEDKVISDVSSWSPSLGVARPLPPNSDNKGLRVNTRDLLYGHDFVGEYMAEGSNTAVKIKEGILGAIDSLRDRDGDGDSNVAVSIGSGHACVMLADKTVRCWGMNGQGQLGDGTNGGASLPLFVKEISNVTSIVTGSQHTCALLTDRTVKCWGWNNFGQLGNGTVFDSSLPVTIPDISNAILISTRNNHTCALLADTTVRCWGSNSNGQLGDGTKTDSFSPVVVRGISGVISISAGHNHTCAVFANKTARCWGWNVFGQLGDGTTSDSLLPVAVRDISDATSISSGFWHTCTIRADGAIIPSLINYSALLFYPHISQ